MPPKIGVPLWVKSLKYVPTLSLLYSIHNTMSYCTCVIKVSIKFMKMINTKVGEQSYFKTPTGEAHRSYFVKYCKISKFHAGHMELSSATSSTCPAGTGVQGQGVGVGGGKWSGPYLLWEEILSTNCISPMDTWCNNNAIITSKWHCNVVLV